ncbi:hypothetical protein L7F22_057347 [Adiantum nelumboides]|nr:hypothetical protein [Adiantum nelumboides]
MGDPQSSHGGLSSCQLLQASLAAGKEGGTARSCATEDEIIALDDIETVFVTATSMETVGMSICMQQAANRFQSRRPMRTHCEGAIACGAEGACPNFRTSAGNGCPQDRLQSHRLQVAGSVRIPDAWCGEARLREWGTSRDVEDALQPPGLFSARAALISACSSRGLSSPTHTVVSLSPCEVSLLS